MQWVLLPVDYLWRLLGLGFLNTPAILIWFCFFPQTLWIPCLFRAFYWRLNLVACFCSCLVKKQKQTNKKPSDLLFPVKHLGSAESSPVHFKCCCWPAFSLGTHSHQLVSLSPWMNKSAKTEIPGGGKAARGETDSRNLLSKALGSPYCSSRPISN